jgi:cell division protein DivIC
LKKTKAIKTFVAYFSKLCRNPFSSLQSIVVKNMLKILTNKYIITAVLFLLLMIFFDQNDWFTQHAREEELQQTQEKIDHLNSEVSRMDKELSDLNSSNTKLEQYAREKYHEKRDGEDVYIIIPDTVRQQKAN